MSILDSLSRTESGGDFTASNNVPGSGGSGHFGRLQFSRGRLQDAERAGVLPRGTTPQQFMANPALQERVEAWHLADMRATAQRMGLDRFIGQNVGGVPITMDAILAMGHLGGMGGAQRYLESNGQYNPADVYGTSLRDYARTHGAASGGRSAPSTGRTPVQSPQYLTPYQGQNALSAAPQMTPEQIDRQQRMNMLSMMPEYQANTLDLQQFQTQPRNALQPFGFGPGQSPFT